LSFPVIQTDTAWIFEDQWLSVLDLKWVEF